MTKISKFINHVVKRELYSNNLKEKAVRLLDELYEEIFRILKIYPYISTKRKYRELELLLKEEIKEFTSRYKDFLSVNIYEISETESVWLTKFFELLGKECEVPENLVFTLKFTPICSNSDYQSLVTKFTATITTRVVTALKTAYLTKEPTSDILKRFEHFIEQSKKSMAIDIESFNSAMFNMTDYYIFESNESRMLYCGLLDSNVCQSCLNNSSKIFIGAEAPLVPLHERCRCFYIDADVDEDLEEMTYTSWLSHEKEEEQLKILGKSRYKLMKNGIKVNKFVNNGVKTSLNDLKTLED